MKKIFLLVALLFALSSCFFSDQNTQEIEDAKTQMLSTGETDTDTQDEIGLKDIQEVVDDIVKIEADEKGFIELNPIDVSTINSEEVVLTGTATGGIDRIDVQFSNETSDFPLDSYTLQTFKVGDTTFKYIASSRQRVLDYGKNTYTFTAYKGKEIGKASVSVFLDKAEGSRKDALEKTGTGGTILEEDSVVPGLTIKQVQLTPLGCDMTDAVTDFLLEKYSWAYWNSCRDIEKEKGIYFNVLRLDGESYIYERHFYDHTNGYYGVLTLETGTGVDKDTMGDKNKELKEKDFEIETKQSLEYFRTLSSKADND